MAKTTKSTDVLNVEVIEELPLEKVIDQTLVKNNVTKQVITALKAKYGKLKLKSVSDKESYLTIKEARKEVRKIGILTEKLCEAGREEAVKIQRLWLAKQKEILGEIATVQDPLDAEMKRFEDEEARIEEERLKRQEEAFMARQSELLKMGAVYANGCFNLNDVSYESSVVKESDADVWENVIRPKFQAQYQKNEADRIEQDRIKKEQEEKFKVQQELLQQQQAELRRQQEEFQRQQEASARQQREKQLEEEKKESERIQAIVNGRAVVLSGLGMKFNGTAYIFEDVNITVSEMGSMQETEWVAWVQQSTTTINGIKQQLEEKRLTEIEDQKRQAAEQERQRIEYENQQKELQRQRDEQIRLEELANATDKVKWQTYLDAINAVPMPEVKAKNYLGKVNVLKQKLVEINSL